MTSELSLWDSFGKLGIALGLGLLIGLQRERTDSKLAGIRTFPLITVFGTLTGLLASAFGEWVLAAGFLAFAVIIASDVGPIRSRQGPSGVTTEVVALLMFGIGAYLVPGHAAVAVVVTGLTAVLLHLKPEMHSFARRLSDKDFRAMMQFVLITLVILPVLPNNAYGPHGVLNPFKIWLMVVLIVGINLTGYVLYKFLDVQHGSVVNGLLGGVISSTATTASYARRTRQAPGAAPASALVILIASTTVFARLLVIIGLTAPAAFVPLAPPLAAMLGAMTLLSAGAWFFGRGKSGEMPEQENPTELKPALIFGLLFSAVLLGTALANHYFGSRGLYAAGALSGLTDMDAITLSTVQIFENQKLAPSLAWRVILVASLANIFFKGILVAVLGDRKLLARIAAFFSLAGAAGLAILFFWP